MTCQVTVFDGVNTVIIEGVQEQNLAFAPVTGGGAIIRFRAGNAIKQQRWRKESYSLSGLGKIPQGLRGLLYENLLTMTVQTGMGVDVFTGFSLGPNERWGLTTGEVSWDLVLEEN